MSRRTKRTPAMQQAILMVLRAGATRGAAAEHAGMSRETMRQWTLDSSRFLAEVERAEADWEVSMIASATRFARSGSGDPLKALAAHPRTRPEWGPNARQTIVVEGGGQPVRVAAEGAGGPDAIARLADLAKTLDVLVRVGVLPPFGGPTIPRIQPEEETP